MASAHTSTADLVRSLGRQAEARDGYERAIAILESLIEKDHATATFRSHLAYSLRRRGLARREMGAPAGARRALELYEGLPSRSGEEWFETACCHAPLAGPAGRDGSGVSAAASASRAETAIALLYKTVTVGYRTRYLHGHVSKTKSTLDPLRNRPDVPLLMMDLAFPANPFVVRR